MMIRLHPEIAVALREDVHRRMILHAVSMLPSASMLTTILVLIAADIPQVVVEVVAPLYEMSHQMLSSMLE